MSHFASRRSVYSCPAALARRRACLPASRFYQSAAYPQPTSFSATETAILSAALRHVASQGFTRDALIRGARDVGYLDVTANLFPRGAFDLVHYHLTTQRQSLKDKVDFLGAEGGDAEKFRMGKKIKAMAWARLKANADLGVIGRWSEALAIMAQPSYVPTALQELGLLADEIWHLAGDKDVSFSWYSKRASLSAVYASSELFMTQDSSSGFKDTEAFLDRRLSEVQTAGYAVGSIGEWAGFSAGALVNVLRSKGARV